MCKPGLVSEKPKLPDDRLPVYPQKNRRPSLRNARIQKEVQAVIEGPLLLAVTRTAATRRKGMAAAPAEVAANPLAVGPPEIASFTDDGSGKGSLVSGGTLRIWALRFHHAREYSRFSPV